MPALRRACLVSGFHDLRQSQTLVACADATTKDLMLRPGHSSPAADYRYLRAVDGRDAEVAAAFRSCCSWRCGLSP